MHGLSTANQKLTAGKALRKTGLNTKKLALDNN